MHQTLYGGKIIKLNPLQIEFCSHYESNSLTTDIFFVKSFFHSVLNDGLHERKRVRQIDNKSKSSTKLPNLSQMT